MTLVDDRGYSGLFLDLALSPPPLTPFYVTLLGGVTPPGQQNSLLLAPPVTAPKVSAALAPVATTLGEVVSSLEPIAGQRATVDTTVRDKPVLTYGLKHTTSRSAMQALAALYGLRNGASTDSAPQLEPVYVAIPTELDQINTAVWAAVPVSYKRALHVTPSEQQYRPETIEVSTMLLPGEMQQEAGQRLIAALQPQIKQSGQHTRVPVSSLDRNAKSDIAVLLMTNLVSALRHGFGGDGEKRAVSCLSNTDQTIIYTVLTETARVSGQDVPSFYLLGTNPETKEQIGLGSVRFFSHD